SKRHELHKKLRRGVRGVATPWPNKGRTNLRPARLDPQSEEQLQSQLDGAAAARSDDRVGSRYVGSGAGACKRTGRRIVVRPPVLSPERIGEVGMIEHVEELGTELRAKALSKLPILSHGEVPVVKAGVAENIPAHRAERSKRRRNHELTA